MAGQRAMNGSLSEKARNCILWQGGNFSAAFDAKHGFQAPATSRVFSNYPCPVTYATTDSAEESPIIAIGFPLSPNVPGPSTQLYSALLHT